MRAQRKPLISIRGCCYNIGSLSPRRRDGEMNMIAVIFEVWPKAGHRQQYLDLAAELRPLLEKIDGFISIERFESLTEPGKILSLSVFRDEAAIAAWRNLDAHRRAQARGRAEVFAGYRLRIAGVIRDYGMDERDQAPADSLGVHG
jgi:heme-degrading monooxygenase HmoA